MWAQARWSSITGIQIQPLELPRFYATPTGQIYSNRSAAGWHRLRSHDDNSDGRLGRANVASRRYKRISSQHKTSEAIYALKPVSFRYHKQYDATQTIAFGLIGEEVAEVNSDLLGTQSRLTAQICSLRTNQRDDSQMSSSKNTAEAKSRIAKSRAGDGGCRTKI